ncbi:tetratricopeptide repeat protein, partial [Candidatus Dependentiae bacterium]|nr:tetratricopeptide repeat protein [Candidatus Dependentiae bacterium]
DDYEVLGLINLKKGNMKLSKKYLEKSLKIREKFFGEYLVPEIARAYANLAEFYEINKDNVKAKEYENKAKYIYNIVYNKDHPKLKELKRN